VAPAGYGQVHHSVCTSCWDPAPSERVLAEEAQALVGGPDAVLIIHDTALLKHGKRSAGVTRQYAGAAGKTHSGPPSSAPGVRRPQAGEERVVPGAERGQRRRGRAGQAAVRRAREPGGCGARRRVADGERDEAVRRAAHLADGCRRSRRGLRSGRRGRSDGSGEDGRPGGAAHGGAPGRELPGVG
jgi:hypothetical protein